MKNKTISIVMALAVVLCVWFAGGQNSKLLKMRADYGVDSAAPLENTPPLIAFTTVALGGFSSLVADILWLRVSTLQEEGRYFELVQLSDWITKLEPRCGDIWEFHSWNMAYNVSVMMPDPEDRWRWVRNGMELLRDEGIRYNAGDPKIYRELAWLFLDKIGRSIDQAHAYYKIKWSEEMTDLFGGAHPDYSLLVSRPEKLRKITTEYKLKVEAMQGIDLEYGPLDWRVPESHAIYWAVSGRKYGGREGALLCERSILQSLKALFMHGRHEIGPDGSLKQAPDIDLLPKITKAYEAVLVKYPDEITIKNSYIDFMYEAVSVLHKNDRQTEARAVFESLSSRFPSDETRQGFEVFISRFIKK